MRRLDGPKNPDALPGCVCQPASGLQQRVFDLTALQSEPVSLIDIVPTILDAAGIPTATPLPGRSLRPALEGSGTLPEHMIYAEKTYHDIYDPTRMIRSTRFNYICYFEKTVIDDVIIATVERSHWVKQSLLGQADEELYDLENDPNEKSNLIDDPDCREQLYAMRAQLYNLMEETNDPLLLGPVARPLDFRILAQLRDAAGKE